MVINKLLLTIVIFSAGSAFILLGIMFLIYGSWQLQLAGVCSIVFGISVIIAECVIKHYQEPITFDQDN